MDAGADDVERRPLAPLDFPASITYVSLLMLTFAAISLFGTGHFLVGS